MSYLCTEIIYLIEKKQEKYMTLQDKTYSIRWYGPFKSKDEIGEYEKKHADVKFQLYIFQGLKPRAKVNMNYYCGQAKSGVYRRLSDKNHHINEINRISAIWIGTISNVIPESNDINYVENIITAQLTKNIGEARLLNIINKKFPNYNIYVINIWHKVNGDRHVKYMRRSIPTCLPDLLGHEYEAFPIPVHKIYGAEKVKWADIDM